MGSHWQVVVDKCCRGHYQPLLLLYSNTECTPINTDSAPQTITKLPGYQEYSFSDDSGKCGVYILFDNICVAYGKDVM